MSLLLFKLIMILIEVLFNYFLKIALFFYDFVDETKRWLEMFLNNYSLNSLKTRFYQAFLSLSIINLLLCIFEVKTLISIIIFVLSFYLYINNKIQCFMDKGLLYYLPYNIKLVLLRRSFFDILCDLWYFSKIKLYLKAIFIPLIIKPSP